VTYARRAVFIPDPDAINVLRTLAATITRARASTAGACRARGGSLSARARGPPEAENAICREAAEKLFWQSSRYPYFCSFFARMDASASTRAALQDAVGSAGAGHTWR